MSQKNYKKQRLKSLIRISAVVFYALVKVGGGGIGIKYLTPSVWRFYTVAKSYKYYATHYKILRQ